MGAATSSLRKVRQVTGTSPAANAELSEVVPAGHQWELIALGVDLVQGATQTPWPKLQVLTTDDPVDEVQTLTLDATPASGSFKLVFTPPDDWPAGTTPLTTAAIDGTSNVTAAEVQAALNAIDGLHEVTVSGSDGGPFDVTFTGGSCGARDLTLLSVTENTLEDAGSGAVTVTPAEDTAGVSGGTVFESPGASDAQSAATTCRYTWGRGLPLLAHQGSGAGVWATAPLPDDLLLQPGWRIITTTAGIGANSDFGAPSLYIVEYG